MRLTLEKGYIRPAGHHKRLIGLRAIVEYAKRHGRRVERIVYMVLEAMPTEAGLQDMLQKVLWAMRRSFFDEPRVEHCACANGLRTVDNMQITGTGRCCDCNLKAMLQNRDLALLHDSSMGAFANMVSMAGVVASYTMVYDAIGPDSCTEEQLVDIKAGSS